MGCVHEHARSQARPLHYALAGPCSGPLRAQGRSSKGRDGMRLAKDAQREGCQSHRASHRMHGAHGEGDYGTKGDGRVWRKVLGCSTREGAHFIVRLA